MATTRIQTGVRFEEDMLLKITYIAKKNRRSFNAQLEFLTEKCIEEYEEAHGKIQVPDEEKHKYSR